MSFNDLSFANRPAKLHLEGSRKSIPRGRAGAGRALHMVPESRTVRLVAGGRHRAQGPAARINEEGLSRRMMSMRTAAERAGSTAHRCARGELFFFGARAPVQRESQKRAGNKRPQPRSVGGCGVARQGPLCCAGEPLPEQLLVACGTSGNRCCAFHLTAPPCP